MIGPCARRAKNSPPPINPTNRMLTTKAPNARQARRIPRLRRRAIRKTVELGISPDSIKSHASFKSKYDLAITLASDETKATCEAYGVWVEKSMYGRKYMGVERTTFLIGPDGRIAEAWPKVKVPGHAEAVLKASQAL